MVQKQNIEITLFRVHNLEKHSIGGPSTVRS